MWWAPIRALCKLLYPYGLVVVAFQPIHGAALCGCSAFRACRIRERVRREARPAGASISPLLLWARISVCPPRCREASRAAKTRRAFLSPHRRRRFPCTAPRLREAWASPREGARPFPCRGRAIWRAPVFPAALGDITRPGNVYAGNEALSGPVRILVPADQRPLAPLEHQHDFCLVKTILRTLGLVHPEKFEARNRARIPTPGTGAASRFSFLRLE